tara:strand:+ start:256 stop:1134 length:879 start_codon:yes stop_codon:yes gene_type:complete
MNHKSGFVNIIGNPNAGKSTLMNALIGEKISIITNKVQTTRHRILGILNDKNYQIVFSDTPGIIDPKYKLQKSMMNFVYSSFEDADILIYIMEAGLKSIKKERIYNQLKKMKLPFFVLVNKIDLFSQDDIVNIIETIKQEMPNAKVLPISALNNFNIDLVKEKIIELLPEANAYYPKDLMTDRSERFFIEEIIREKILIHYKQEIPYSVEVKVDEFEEESDLVKIRASIFVMRESQKAILIGHKGLGLKRIGTESRRDIEKMINKKIFLKTHIKVNKNWRDDIRKLKQFGYE